MQISLVLLKRALHESQSHLFCDEKISSQKLALETG